jgi:hypothetical protein
MSNRSNRSNGSTHARVTMPKEPTAQQRAQVATAQLRALVAADDAKLLNAAIVEAAAEEALRSATFRASVRRVYDELTAHQRNSTRNGTRAQRGKGQPPAELVPLPGSEGARFDPFAPLDPYALLRLYGPHQLRAALSGYSR